MQLNNYSRSSPEGLIKKPKGVHMSKESFDKGRIDAAKDSARDSRQRAADAITDITHGSRDWKPPSGTADDRKDYGKGWRSEKNK